MPGVADEHVRVMLRVWVRVSSSYRHGMCGLRQGPQHPVTATEECAGLHARALPSSMRSVQHACAYFLGSGEAAFGHTIKRMIDGYVLHTAMNSSGARQCRHSYHALYPTYAVCMVSPRPLHSSVASVGESLLQRCQAGQEQLAPQRARHSPTGAPGCCTTAAAWRIITTPAAVGLKATPAGRRSHMRRIAVRQHRL